MHPWVRDAYIDRDISRWQPPATSRFSAADYARNVREVSADVREWGDATPNRVRERCLQAEAERDRLEDGIREALRAMNMGLYQSARVELDKLLRGLS